MIGVLHLNDFAVLYSSWKFTLPLHQLDLLPEMSKYVFLVTGTLQIFATQAS